MPVDADRSSAASRSPVDVRGIERVPGVAKPDRILLAEHVVRRFGGLVAVDVDRFELQGGSITALIGPNGAGKTTFFNLLTGFDRPDTGSIEFEGISTASPLLGFAGPRVLAPSPYRLARRGMVRTFQLTKALSKMTVIDNMRLGAVKQNGENLLLAPFRPLWSGREAAITDRADALLERFKLDHMRDEFAGTLSGGQRKLLEMARALMTEPVLVMLDEPMAGVNPALKQSLLEHIVSLQADGVTVLFVEHDMDMVREISDWVVVMAEGRIIAEATSDEIGDNPDVVDAYLGAHHDQDLDVSDQASMKAGRETPDEGDA